MHLKIITNPDVARKDRYEIARAIYAETAACSLRAVEALASMIDNAAHAAQCNHVDIVRNNKMFTSCNNASPRHSMRNVRADDPGFQMCLRVTQKMMNAKLPDMCCGATRFHHDTEIPQWATSCGYIADIDGMLFYA